MSPTSSSPWTPALLPLLFSLLLPSCITVSASPSPAYLVGDDFTHLVPRGALFFRQADNLQSFTGALGGFGASAITKSGDGKRVFSVDGDTFPDFDSAGQRSCDNQFQKCSEAANRNKKAGFSVGDCDGQKGKCTDAQKTATVKDFSTAQASTNIGPDPAFPDFDLICDA